jgi:hypothetical protein
MSGGDWAHIEGEERGTMSLTSFLELNKDVRERFRQEFQKPRFSAKKDLLAPPLTKRYSLIGTAFDYLLRFYLQHLNPNTVARERWVAEAALAYITDNSPLLSMGEKIASQAKERLRVFLKTGQMSDELMESALLLAQLDPIFRAGVGHEYVGNIFDDDVEDLRNLISIVDPDVFRAKELCLVNPVFGMASVMVGGADADLVIDDTIVDVKTTKNLRLQRKDFDQLMGYYVLHEVSGVGELVTKPEITKVAIYFSRHGYLHVLELQEIVDWRTFPDFVHWFKSRASQEYGVLTL